jgi:hypothetical protein
LAAASPLQSNAEFIHNFETWFVLELKGMEAMMHRRAVGAALAMVVSSTVLLLTSRCSQPHPVDVILGCSLLPIFWLLLIGTAASGCGCTQHLPNCLAAMTMHATHGLCSHHLP